MSLPKQKNIKKTELTSFKNPRAILSDKFYNPLKVAYKEGIINWSWFRIKSLPLELKSIPKGIAYGMFAFIWAALNLVIKPIQFLINPIKFIKSLIKPDDDHHDLIIPATKNHTSWTLGAQPGDLSIANVKNENPNKKIHIVSMLSDGERVILPSNETSITTGENDKVYFHGDINDDIVDRVPWGDHGTINLVTGKNQTVESMISFQKKLHEEFKNNKDLEAFYCHCMAGKSRSFVETMSFIYFYPDKTKLFDFENWPPEIKNTIPQDLQNRLRDNPSFSDIAEYVSLRRPQVKKLYKMDGDQAGLLGLMSLAKAAKENIRSIPNENQEAKTRLYKDAQNIGLMLKAPLDNGFRDQDDREQQENNLISVSKQYQKQGINLLMAMVVPINKSVDQEKYNDIKEFEKNFKNLKPSEQARFAILLQKLEQDPSLDLGPLRGKSSRYANIVMSTGIAKKLTSGDQVELMKAFRSDPNFSAHLRYANVTEKILKGNKVDRYNAGIQLAELLHTLQADTKKPLEFERNNKLIEQIIKNNKLSYIEQVKFVQRLQELGDHRTAKYAGIALDNYNHRWFPFFNSPLSSEQTTFLENAKSSTFFSEQEKQLTGKIISNLEKEEQTSKFGSNANIRHRLLGADKTIQKPHHQHQDKLSDKERLLLQTTEESPQEEEEIETNITFKIQ